MQGLKSDGHGNGGTLINGKWMDTLSPDLSIQEIIIHGPFSQKGTNNGIKDILKI